VSIPAEYSGLKTVTSQYLHVPLRRGLLLCASVGGSRFVKNVGTCLRLPNHFQTLHHKSLTSPTVSIWCWGTPSAVNTQGVELEWCDADPFMQYKDYDSVKLCFSFPVVLECCICM